MQHDIAVFGNKVYLSDDHYVALHGGSTAGEVAEGAIDTGGYISASEPRYQVFRSGVDDAPQHTVLVGTSNAIYAVPFSSAAHQSQTDSTGA
jgi:hypothetical protein